MNIKEFAISNPTTGVKIVIELTLKYKYVIFTNTEIKIIIKIDEYLLSDNNGNCIKLFSI